MTAAIWHDSDRDAEFALALCEERSGDRAGASIRVPLTVVRQLVRRYDEIVGTETERVEAIAEIFADEKRQLEAEVEDMRRAHSKALGEFCEQLAGARAETLAVAADRDEARRQIVERITGEWGGYFLVLAAERWGREAALELYPDARLRDAWADRNFGVAFADVPDEDDRAEIEERLASERANLDEKHPSTE